MLIQIFAAPYPSRRAKILFTNISPELCDNCHVTVVIRCYMFRREETSGIVFYGPL